MNLGNTGVIRQCSPEENKNEIKDNSNLGEVLKVQGMAPMQNLQVVFRGVFCILLIEGL